MLLFYPEPGLGNVTYKRGQVEWALWRAFTLARSPGDGPPPIFRTRIKRLLDLDRELDAGGLDAPPPCAFAFVAPSEGGSGIEAQYTPFDAFCLAIALDLLEVGFKQGEIVLLMRHLRDTLADWFDDLLKRPSLFDRQAHLAKHYPGLPSLERSGGRAPIADARVFLLLNRIEMTELMPLEGKPGRAVFLEPEVCEGVARLQQRLDALMPRHQRTVITTEITATAQAVATFLDAAPLVPRGRPRRQQA
jgi:hypothetical protein